MKKLPQPGVKNESIFSFFLTKMISEFCICYNTNLTEGTSACVRERTTILLLIPWRGKYWMYSVSITTLPNVACREECSKWKWWFEWKWFHQVMCWWNCVGRIRRYGFTGEVVSLWAGLGVSKALLSGCISRCKLSSDPTLCLPACCHVPCHDVHVP